MKSEKLPAQAREWSMFLPGEPVAMGRARAAVIGGHARVYTPTKTAAWQGFAVVLMRREWRGRHPLTGPVALNVQLYFKRPARLLTKRWRDVPVEHITKPDASNCLKNLEDAMEKAGIVRNDSQFSDVHVVKLYATGAGQPGMLVQLVWEEEA